MIITTRTTSERMAAVVSPDLVWYQAHICEGVSCWDHIMGTMDAYYAFSKKRDAKRLD